MDSTGRPDATSQRSLAAIVFTDAVGFSKRVGENEERTLKLIKSDLDLMSTLCKRFEGQVIKSNGDGLMMMFSSAVQAMTCALEIQKILTEQAKANPDALMHRIGIHLGDVLFADGDALGDGVNVASRLEQEAEPGGICMSQTVYDVVKNRLFLQAARIGDLKLKNIAEPVAAYKVAGVAKARKHTRVYRLNWVAIIGTFIVVVGIAVGGTFWSLKERNKAADAKAAGQNKNAAATKQDASAPEIKKPSQNSDAAAPRRDVRPANESAPPATNPRTVAPPATNGRQAATVGTPPPPTNGSAPPGTPTKPTSAASQPGSKVDYAEAWGQYARHFQFKAMSNWISQHPNDLPPGETLAVAQARYAQLNDLVDWFFKTMATHDQSNPLTFMWQHESDSVFQLPDGRLTISTSTGPELRRIRFLSLPKFAAMARGMVLQMQANRATKNSIREDIKALVSENQQHVNLVKQADSGG